MARIVLSKELLEAVYERFNRPEFIAPDPLQCVLKYRSLRDRELVGLIASGLAYGRVASILVSVDKVLAILGPQPSKRLEELDDRWLDEAFADFRHRWTSGEEVASLLKGIRNTRAQYGSLEKCFLSAKNEEPSVVSGLTSLMETLLREGGLSKNSLLPQPASGSASKRPLLFLRWMVRKDAVDPGGWKKVDPAGLIVPLDTHMYQFAKKMRMTRRKQANLKTAVEITSKYARFCPEDPVKYDFALTRLGIRLELSADEVLADIHRVIDK